MLVISKSIFPSKSTVKRKKKENQLVDFARNAAAINIIFLHAPKKHFCLFFPFFFKKKSVVHRPMAAIFFLHEKCAGENL